LDAFKGSDGQDSKSQTSSPSQEFQWLSRLGYGCLSGMLTIVSTHTISYPQNPGTDEPPEDLINRGSLLCLEPMVKLSTAVILIARDVATNLTLRTEAGYRFRGDGGLQKKK